VTSDDDDGGGGDDGRKATIVLDDQRSSRVEYHGSKGGISCVALSQGKTKGGR